MKVYDNESPKRLVSLFVSEVCATAMLQALICLSCVNNELFPSNMLQCAISCGFTVGVCIQCFGCISGCHINPAVSVAAFMLGNLSLMAMALYIVAQLMGSLIGYAIFLGMVPEEALSDTICLTLIHPTCSTLKGFLIELVLTSCLIFFCCGVWDKRNARYGDSVAVKFAVLVTLVVITGGYFTGASINPARSFAPAVFHNNFDRYWVYILSHAVAATAVPLFWMFAFPPPTVTAKQEESDEDV